MGLCAPSEKHGPNSGSERASRGAGLGAGPGGKPGGCDWILKTLFFKKNFILQLLKGHPGYVIIFITISISKSQYGLNILKGVMLAKSHPKGPSNTTLPHSSSSSCLGWRDS